MKIASTIFFLIIACSAAYSQKWHSASDSLKYPVKLRSNEASMGWVNQYDTIACSLELTNKSIITGYKVMLLYNGYFVDNQYTINVFFNDKKKRINNVSFYSYD